MSAVVWPQFSSENMSFRGELVSKCTLNWERVVMQKIVARFLKDESGATAIEYGLIAALISVVIITTVTSVGGNLDAVFQTIDAALTN